MLKATDDRWTSESFTSTTFSPFDNTIFLYVLVVEKGGIGSPIGIKFVLPNATTEFAFSLVSAPDTFTGAVAMLDIPMTVDAK
jgi:hypothetical protein